MLADRLRPHLEALGLLALTESTLRAVRERTTARGRRERALRRRMGQFYAQFLGPGDLAFDVGAHVGSRVELFLELGASVVAVEPQEACRRRLHRHFGGDPRVSIIPRALDAAPGDKELRGHAASPMASLSPSWIEAVNASGRFAEAEFSRVERVKTTTLDALVAVYGAPRFCKIDVEGFEHEVLQGLSQPIPALSLEFTPETRDKTVRCLEHLDGLAPYAFNFSAGEECRLDLPAWLARGPFLDALDDEVRRRGSMLFGDVYARTP